MFSIPKTTDTEEDLLLQQEKFLKIKNKAAEENIREHLPENSDPDWDMDVDLQRNDDHISAILPRIFEQDTCKSSSISLTSNFTGGFPDAVKLDDITSSKATKKRKSLFAQQMGIKSKKGDTHKFDKNDKNDAEKQTGREDLVDENAMKISLSSETSSIPMTSSATSSEGLSISNQLLKAQQNLLDTLDDKTIAFLKNRGKKKIRSEKAQEIENEHKTMKTTKPNQDNSVQNIVLPKELENTAQYYHMNVIESEKLKWMQDIKTDTKLTDEIEKQVRFNFAGDIVFSSDDIPTDIGLHHHGDEPDRPGYTTGELFHLIRSANIQQKAFALHLVAKIIRKAYQGFYTDIVSTSLIPAMLDGGLIFLIRWGLDDTTISPRAASVECLHALLVCQSEQMTVDMARTWWQGLSLPYLHPASEMTDGSDDDKSEDNQDQLTDEQLCKQDLIKGLERMMLIQRLRYCLNQWRPSKAIVSHILQILTRCARHSSEIAYKIVQCQGLLNNIVDNFLPASWKNDKDSYKHLNNNAIRLFSILCASGRHMADRLITEYRLVELVHRYLIIDKSEFIPPEELIVLQSDCLSLLQVIATYGFTNQFSDIIYPVLIKRLPMFYEYSLEQQQPCQQKQQQQYYDNCYLNTYVISLFNNSLELFVQSMTSILRYNLSDIYDFIVSFVSKLTQQFANDFIQKSYNLNLFSTCLNLLSSFLHHYQHEICPEKLNIIFTDVLKLLLSSPAFSYACVLLRDESVLLSHVINKEIPSCLPTLYQCSKTDGCQSDRSQTGVIGYLISVGRLLHTITATHSPFIQQYILLYLCNKELLQYMNRCCHLVSMHSSSQPFVIFDNLLQYYMIKLSIHISKDYDMSMIHLLSLRLLARIQSGQEYIASDLLLNVIFHVNLLSLSKDKYLERMKCLSISESAPYDMIEQTCRLSPIIRQTYLSVLQLMLKKANNSRALLLQDKNGVNRVFIGDCIQGILPIDWVFLPLIQLYNNSQPVEKSSIHPHNPTDADGSSTLISQVSGCLAWIYLLEVQQPTFMSHISLLTKISRIMCTFLAGNDLFLNKDIERLLASLFEVYSKPSQLDHINFTMPIPGMSSFYDFYDLFVQHYAGVSFGATVFALYLCLPLQQCHPVSLRKMVWDEHSHVLRSIIIPLKKMTINIERFLMPEETDLEMIRLYMEALLSGKIILERNPLPYLIAVHHTNRYMYTKNTKHQPLQAAIFQQAVLTENKTLKHHLIYYNRYEGCFDDGIECYQTLPTNRQQLYSTYEGEEIEGT